MEFETGPESRQPIEPLPTKEGYDRWSEIYDDEANPLIVQPCGQYDQTREITTTFLIDLLKVARD